MQTLPSHAKVVIVGGGIVGCSTAYHLAKLGCSDVVLLEKAQLTSGTTWHAAGAVGNLRGSSSLTRLVKDSIDLYGTLEAETGQATGWVNNGSLRVAVSQEREAELRRVLTLVRAYGIEAEIISAREAQEKLPVMNVDDVRCALWLPGDGMASPSDVTMALAKGARQNGAKIFERTRVLSLDVGDDEVRGVVTEHGRIACERVVLCTGVWTRELARTVGVNVPLQPTYVQYAISERIPGLPRHAPCLRDPDLGTFFKEEVGGLAFGGYERTPTPYLDSPVLPNEEFKLFAENFETFEYLMEGALHRIPALAETGIKTWIHGLDSFTDDGAFILGEAPEVRNLFVGAGFNGFGIASGGGAGKALASWVLEGAPPYDLWVADIRRFGAHMRSDAQVVAHAMEGFANHYAKGDPTEILKAGRPLRLSPVHARCAAAGAVFEPVQGWEIPAWFAPGGEARDEAISRERDAAVKTAAIFDLGSLAKFRLLGAGAQEALQGVASSDVGSPGEAKRTLFLSERGGVLADVLVVSTSHDDHTVLAPAASATLVGSHLRREILGRGNVVSVDVSAGYAAIGLTGPQSAAILEAVAEDFSASGMPSETARPTILAGAPVTLARLPETHPLTWLALVSSEYAVAVWDALARAGARHGLALAGARALTRLGTEAGVAEWGRDFGSDATPYEVGLASLVDLDRKGFTGSGALRKLHSASPRKRLVRFRSRDRDAVLSGAEAIFRDGVCVGWTTSGAWSEKLGVSIAIGFVRATGARGVDLDGIFELRKGAASVAVEVSPEDLIEVQEGLATAANDRATAAQ